MAHRDLLAAALLDPQRVGHGLSADRAGHDGDLAVAERRLAALEAAVEAARDVREVAAEVKLALAAVLGNAAVEVELHADLCGVVGVVERVVCRAILVEGDLEMLHRQREGALLLLTVGLGVVDGLQVVAVGDPLRVDVVHEEVVKQHRDVVPAPGQQDAGRAAPDAEVEDGLGEGAAVRDVALAQAGHLLDALVQLGVVGRRDGLLEFVNDLQPAPVVAEHDGTDLNDLADQRKGRALNADGRVGLVPFHIQYNVIHPYKFRFCIIIPHG